MPLPKRQGKVTLRYFGRRVPGSRSWLEQERWALVEARLERLLRAAEANLQANTELRQQQEEQQRQLEAERRQSEALRNSTADLRISVMELRGAGLLAKPGGRAARLLAGAPQRTR